jgi:hypothetical protein
MVAPARGPGREGRASARSAPAGALNPVLRLHASGREDNNRRDEHQDCRRPAERACESPVYVFAHDYGKVLAPSVVAESAAARSVAERLLSSLTHPLPPVTGVQQHSRRAQDAHLAPI